MAHSETNADAAVRAYLLAEVKDFRRLMVDTMLGDSTESAQFTWDALSGRVDAIAAGKSVTLSRYELPDGHPLATAGHPSDSLELGEDNVVRPSDQDHLFGIRGVIPADP